MTSADAIPVESRADLVSEMFNKLADFRAADIQNVSDFIVSLLQKKILPFAQLAAGIKLDQLPDIAEDVPKVYEILGSILSKVWPCACC